MPATSLKQKRFMDAAAHNPAFAKKAGVPVSVAKDFSEATKGQFAKKGTAMATKKPFSGKETPKEEAMERKKAPSKAAYKKAEMQLEGERYAKGGGIEVRGKTKGTVIKMAKGGKARCK